MNWNGQVPSRSELTEIKRNLVLRTASHMFNERGYQGTSLDEVARMVGVTKPALYYYFSNKEQLLYECLKITYDCGSRTIEKLRQHPGPAFDRLRLFLFEFARDLMETQGAFTTRANLMALPDDLRAELMERRRVMDRFSRDLLTACQAEGSIRELDVQIASNYYLGSINWILRWYNPEQHGAPGDVAAMFVDMIVNGLSRQKADGRSDDAFTHPAAPPR